MNTPNEPAWTRKARSEPWQFAGWGKASKLEDLEAGPIHVEHIGVSQRHSGRLGVLAASAICGNDITSSVLYVSALTITVAGIYAPLGLLLVSLVLFGFRKIYGEVGSALPLNGGAYTVLLNTTNKKTAAAAATFTLISYLATAVISATEAMHYLQTLVSSVHPIPAAMGLLAFFAALAIIGITESAKLAAGIFLLHLVSLTLLVGACAAAIVHQGLGPLLTRAMASTAEVSPFKGILLGFCAGMLGISGFESSANYIEEQAPGVFPKTLRNMWLAITIFNPLICVLALMFLGVAASRLHQNSLLTELGAQTGGPWLAVFIGIDAVLVLSGAVLTSFVGVTGLVRRMTLDRCLPQFLLHENRARKTNHWIILAFLTLACLILAVTSGDVESLAGVYSISFLSVMAMFAIGNLLLKKERSKLPRAERAGTMSVILCLGAVLGALSANLSARNVENFSIFAALLGGAVGIMLSRLLLLRLGLYTMKHLVDRYMGLSRDLQAWIYRKIREVSDQPVVYFSRADELPVLNHAALYVLKNEQSSNLIVIHFYEQDPDLPPHLASQLQTIDQLYPELRVDFLAVRGKFGPETIEKISHRLGIPKNCMFIGTPGHGFKHLLAEFGGVRIIV